MATQEQSVRRRLPEERNSITHKFNIAGHEGYITVGLYDDGKPGELFLTMAREGSTISGFAAAFAQAVSYCLQYGMPLEALVENFKHSRFAPSGYTRNADIRFAKSVVDYIFRWMELRFSSPEVKASLAMPPHPDLNGDSPACRTCGTSMDFRGELWKCGNCGSVIPLGS